MKFRNQRGQAVLIVLLSLSVVLIVSLFVLSRSITDISLSSKEGNSLRAFSAAEAGIERALIIGSDIGNTTIGDASFSADVSKIAEGAKEVVYPLALKSGESATFWFTRPSTTGFKGDQMQFCWGTDGTSASNGQTPALEISIYYTSTPNDISTLKIARVLVDPNVSRRSSNHFEASASNCTIDSENFEFKENVAFSSVGIANANTPNVLQYAVVKMIYNSATSHKVGINVNYSNGSILPSQGIRVDSLGTSVDANRKIQVYELHSVVPPIFNNALFSTSDIQ